LWWSLVETWSSKCNGMMEEAWKSRRQVCRLLLAMDRWKGEWFRSSSSLQRGLEAKRVSSLKDDSQVAIVRSVLNSLASIAQKFKSDTNEWIFGFYMKYTWERRAIGWSELWSWTLMKAWRRKCKIQVL